jgi:hypothetical protein
MKYSLNIVHSVLMHHDRSFPGFRERLLGLEVVVMAFIQI